jgi:CheY-like chemotaxis protein
VPTNPDPRPARLDPWPLVLRLDQVLGWAGRRVVAIHDPGDPAAEQRHGRLADPDAAASTDPPQAVPAQAPRVLLVDDNPAMRRVLRGLLEDAGIEVVGEATNGLEGIAQAQALQPDVVLMDWRMPQLDGLQATSRIRQQLPQVQVVMFSSAVGAGQGDQARQAGASTFVAKGAPPEQLCAAVRAAWRPA